MTALALPLTAVLLLRATLAHMALFGVAGQLPDFLFGRFARFWVELGANAGETGGTATTDGTAASSPLAAAAATTPTGAIASGPAAAAARAPPR